MSSMTTIEILNFLFAERSNYQKFCIPVGSNYLQYDQTFLDNLQNESTRTRNEVKHDYYVLYETLLLSLHYFLL